MNWSKIIGPGALRMPTQCVMCGKQVASGILCDSCDRPRRTDTKKTKPGETAHAEAIDPFPKATVVPFPIESASLAATSLCDVLTVARVPSLLLGADRSVRFVADEARTIMGMDASAPLPTVRAIESMLGIQLTSLSARMTMTTTLAERVLDLSLVPLSGGASGAVLILQPRETVVPQTETGQSIASSAAPASLMTFVRETIFTPLVGLREALEAASSKRKLDPLVEDCAMTIDQILSSLELSPVAGEAVSRRAPSQLVSDVIRRVALRHEKEAAAKSIKLQLDITDLQEMVRDHQQLESVLSTLVENSLHYVPAGGQVVLGLRFLEHKGKPLLLFFVMDNGPVVPESYRDAIFSAGFIADPNSPERSGRGLAKCREFAIAHGGQIWVESKTGKACTFFLRIRPDEALSA